jgi:hypothetical protein
MYQVVEAVYAGDQESLPKNYALHDIHGATHIRITFTLADPEEI